MKEIFNEYPDMMNVEQLQDALNIGRSLAYKLLRENKIRAVRLGKNYRIPKKSLIEYVLGKQKDIVGVT